MTALVGLSAALAASCSDPGTAGRSDDPDGAGGGARVVASTSVWADVVANVGCGQFEVDSLVPAGVDSHSYEPSVRDADELAGASLVVVNGLGLEAGLTATMDAVVGDDTTVLELGSQLRPIRDDDGVDPHVWMDPDRVADAVPLIVDAMVELDSDLSEDRIRACAQNYLEELQALSDELESEFDGMDPSLRNLVADHAALGYLADRFGLTVVGSVAGSTNPLAEGNARDLDELAATMADLRIDRVLGEHGEAGEAAEALSERLGSPILAVGIHTESVGPPGSGADSYLGMMRTNGRLVAGQ